MTLTNHARALRIISIGAIVAFIAVFVYQCSPARSRDNGQWATDAAISKWYRDLRQADSPDTSCCGEADAYYADSFEVEGDQYVAIITDDRDFRNLGRPDIAVGTKILVPNYKRNIDSGNPTGHGVIFVGSDGRVLCYVAPGGG
jgi:hypothetical protein